MCFAFYLDCKEIKPVNPKGNHPWIFTERTDAEAEAPILWPPDVKNRFIGKDLDAGKDWRQEEKGVTEDETVGWHHQLGGNEFEQTQGDSEGGSLEFWAVSHSLHQRQPQNKRKAWRCLPLPSSCQAEVRITAPENLLLTAEPQSQECRAPRVLCSPSTREMVNVQLSWFKNKSHQHKALFFKKVIPQVEQIEKCALLST